MPRSRAESAAPAATPPSCAVAHDRNASGIDREFIRVADQPLDPYQSIFRERRADGLGGEAILRCQERHASRIKSLVSPATAGATPSRSPYWRCRSPE